MLSTNKQIATLQVAMRKVYYFCSNKNYYLNYLRKCISKFVYLINIR